jgi:hypothetical protein
MTSSTESEIVTRPKRNGNPIGWAMIALTVIFILLYSAALVGWLRPLADITMIARLEPIIFIIIGYYFGRLPAQQNELNLRQEIERLIRKSELAQRLKEQANSERETIEEKIKNARVALRTELLDIETEKQRSPESIVKAERDRGRAVETAMNILNS